MFTDTIGITEREYNAIESEISRMTGLGYNVPDVQMVNTSLYMAMTIGGKIYLNHTNGNLDVLLHVLRHEIGHNNEQGIEFDLWSDNEVGPTADAYKVYASQVSEYAKTSPSEFYAELFAIVTSPDYDGSIECDYLIK